MNDLYIKSFKAFEGEQTITTYDFDKQGVMLGSDNNLLLYGDNGAGKSSVYEALKLVFFHEKIENTVIPPNITGAARSQSFNNWLSDTYDNRKGGSFCIKADGVDFRRYNVSAINAYMISHADIEKHVDQIDLRNLYADSFISTDSTTDPFTTGIITSVIESVNDTIKKSFRLDITIEYNAQNGHLLVVKDDKRSLKYSGSLRDHFNEAKLHLIIIMLLLEYAYVSSSDQKKNILVLDDFLTSMDASNRIFLIKYIIERFQKFQKIIFTHNVSFYNLVDYIANIEKGDSEKWVKRDLYEFGTEHRIVPRTIPTIEEIEADFKSASSDFDSVGNKLRQRFEVFIHEIEKLNKVGFVEESRMVIEQICNDDTFPYLSIQDKDGSKVTNVFELIDCIYSNLTNGNTYKLQERLKEKIDNFRTNGVLPRLKETINDMRVLQKVVLHQMSHGHNGLPPITKQEIEISIDALKKIEKVIKLSQTASYDVSSI